MAITQVTFDLSLRDPETDEAIKANVYTVEGVTDASGNLRLLSIGQLVMAICLQRASQLEEEIIAMMKEMEETSEQLEELSRIESETIAAIETNNGTEYKLNGTDSTKVKDVEILVTAGVLDSSYYTTDSDGNKYYEDVYIVSKNTELNRFEVLYDDFITKIEAKMDEKNSFSQQTMIELQSKTNKRDQSYDMISNVLKSLNTTMTGNVNNM
jgi:hypothetical protein